MAALVGFGEPGLGCFVVDCAKESGAESKGKAIAIIKIKEGGEGSVDAVMLEMCLGENLSVEVGMARQEACWRGLLGILPFCQ